MSQIQNILKINPFNKKTSINKLKKKKIQTQVLKRRIINQKKEPFINKIIIPVTIKEETIHKIVCVTK
jgi:hypothetical protein